MVRRILDLIPLTWLGVGLTVAGALGAWRLGHAKRRRPFDFLDYRLGVVLLFLDDSRRDPLSRQGLLDEHDEPVELADAKATVSQILNIHGDDIVLRLFNTQAQLLKIEELGFEDYAMPKLKEALNRPHGMLLVVGPTGAGKTSTIYAILNELNTEDVKIITLEDPVELEMPGTTQSQINEGESFADRLKAVLREDPDIIMVGEIREASTAATALQAALTGHLLISTLHANDSVTAITRLVGMIDEPALITASTNLIIAQRLVRKICPDCKEEYIPNRFEMQEFQKIVDTLPTDLRPSDNYKFYHGKGCATCHHIGFKGRLGIFELLQINAKLQKMIQENAPIFDLQAAARESGMVTMEQDGILKALAGVTTLSEVLKSVREN
jgi:type II secretory ATPase GspE/PulE/Tfp pilus assembly ATPase PilB-like protein